MKVINHILGRVIMPVPTEEVVPKENMYLPDVINAIADKYHFIAKPDVTTLSPDDVSTKGLVFRLGKFEYDQKEIGITEFTVYDLGLSVSTFKTEVGQAFIHDCFRMLTDHYDFRGDLITDSRMLVLSEMLVEFDDVLDNAIKNFDAISQLLQKLLVNHYGLHEKYRLGGMSFDFSRELIPQPLNNLALFYFERRANTPFKENRYFARAPFHTHDHIQILSDIENIFK